jgi:selenocysteine-specific elongation factor
MILGTAGHIDHGKTTLVRALTGVDTDRLPEEKKRGITIELGFAPLVLDGVGTIGVVDVPGHEAFVRTMVAGATGIDLALVVVAADEGLMPQTREHLAILELLGVHNGVVALTKCDLVDDEWLEMVKEEVRAASSRALPDAPIIATSATTGLGLEELRKALATVASKLPKRGDDDLFRLPVDRVFTIKGTGTVVTGTVWSGHVNKDDNVRILPGEKTARVRGIQNHGSAADAAVPGARTAVALAGVEVGDVPRGSTIVTDREWHPTAFARAELTMVDGAEIELRPRTWFRFHVGTSEVGARVIARDVEPGKPFAARIVLDEPVLLRAGDRFVLRTSAPLNTIAGGVITDPYAPRRAKLWRPGLDDVARLRQFVEEAGGQGVDPATLPVRLGRSSADCRVVVSAADDLEQFGGRIVAKAMIADMRRKLLADVEDWHAAHPMDPGIPTQAARSRLGGSETIAESVIQAELAMKALASSSGALSVIGWSPKLSGADAVLAESVLKVLDQAGHEPPSAEELALQLGASPEGILRFLERRGDIVQVEAGRYYTSAHLKSLIDRLRGVLSGGAEANPSQIRDGLGLSRKYLIPFLEYCDRVGYTNRHAGGRVWKGT